MKTNTIFCWMLFFNWFNLQQDNDSMFVRYAIQYKIVTLLDEHGSTVKLLCGGMMSKNDKLAKAFSVFSWSFLTINQWYSWQRWSQAESTLSYGKNTTIDRKLKVLLTSNDTFSSSRSVVERMGVMRCGWMLILEQNRDFHAKKNANTTNKGWKWKRCITHKWNFQSLLTLITYLCTIQNQLWLT